MAFADKPGQPRGIALTISLSSIPHISENLAKGRVGQAAG